MTAFDYARPRATATRLIKRFGYTATLERPGAPTGPDWNQTPGTPARHPITVVENTHRVRDQSGTLIGQTLVTLTISTEGGIVPAKGDRVALVAPADVTSGTAWHEVGEPRRVAPGGVAVMYEVDLNG